LWWMGTFTIFFPLLSSSKTKRIVGDYGRDRNVCLPKISPLPSDIGLRSQLRDQHICDARHVVLI
jgi:hypothetical protein